MAKGLEFLKQQGLENFELDCGTRGGNDANIRMERQMRFVSSGNLLHIRRHARRLLCSQCELPSGVVAIKCNMIDPDRRGESWVAKITSGKAMSLEEWGVLARSLPCEPVRI